MTAREMRIGEETVSAIDFMSRLLGAIEDGNWRYATDKAGQLDRATKQLVDQLKRKDQTAAAAPVAEFVRRESRHYRIGKALYGSPSAAASAPPQKGREADAMSRLVDALAYACYYTGAGDAGHALAVGLLAVEHGLTPADAAALVWMPRRYDDPVDPRLQAVVNRVEELISKASHGSHAAASPLAQAEAAKANRDLAGEIGALMDGGQALKSAPWHPARPGDLLHVAYSAIAEFPAWGETYLVEPAKDGPEGYLALRLLAHTLPASMGDGGAGAFATDWDEDPIFTPWFEAGPAALTIVRDGQVVHGGGAG